MGNNDNSIDNNLQSEIQETKSMTMNLENLQKKYSNLLISYQQAVANYLDAASPANDNTFTAMKGYAFNGTGNLGVTQAKTYQDCSTACASTANCTGATFVSNQCLMRTGESPVIKSSSDSYAIVPPTVFWLNSMENINQQLIDVNQKITNEMTNANSLYDTQTKERSQQQKNLIKNYVELVDERNKIMDLLKEYETLDNTSSNDQIMVNQRFYVYVFLSILAIAVIFLLFKISYPSKSQQSTPTVQYGGDLGISAYFILFIIIVVTVLIRYLSY